MGNNYITTIDVQEIEVIDIEKDVIPPKNIINTFIKCLMIGSSGVGKSSILERYSSNVFYNHFITTIGVDYKIKNILLDDYNIKLQLWDTASQERFRCITTSYYRNSHIIIVCYDMTDTYSFNELDFWIEDATKHISEPILMAICGTKLDLEKKRTISYDEGKNYANYKNLPYFEISSKDNTGIELMFETLLKIKLSEPEFIKITIEPNISTEKYDVLTVNYLSDKNYYGEQQHCCSLY
jgi:Ras-related protein Rab-1A